jgi:hypothetical protein
VVVPAAGDSDVELEPLMLEPALDPPGLDMDPEDGFEPPSREPEVDGAMDVSGRALGLDDRDSGRPVLERVDVPVVPDERGSVAPIPGCNAPAEPWLSLAPGVPAEDAPLPGWTSIMVATGWPSRIDCWMVTR